MTWSWKRERPVHLIESDLWASSRSVTGTSLRSVTGSIERDELSAMRLDELD